MMLQKQRELKATPMATISRVISRLRRAEWVTCPEFEFPDWALRRRRADILTRTTVIVVSVITLTPGTTPDKRKITGKITVAKRS